MRTVVTGFSKIKTGEYDDVIPHLLKDLGNVRFIHELEKLTIAATYRLLKIGNIDYPMGNSDIGIYLCVEGRIDEINSDYFTGILRYGLDGASPLLFPYTSPNAFAGKLAMVFDIRGENISFITNDNYNFKEVMKYSAECVHNGHVKMAIAGRLGIYKDRDDVDPILYEADLYLIEAETHAIKRNVKMYSYFEESDFEDM